MRDVCIYCQYVECRRNMYFRSIVHVLLGTDSQYAAAADITSANL